MAGRKIDPERRKKFWDLVQKGWSVRAAAEQVNVSLPTAYSWTKDVKDVRGKNWKEQQLENRLPAPKKRVQGEAFYCLKNFAEWRKRYLGRTSTPWQIEAANRCVEWINSKETEFAVINCPPGSGKSTLFTHDIPTWLICRDRTIRIMIGSANLRLASKYSGRIRRTLERVRPLPDCPASLAMEYGRFRPEQPDLWRRDEFIVLPYDDEPIEDKEPTVSSFGMETEFLGTRANFIVWDDLVTNKTMATDEKIEKLQVWWDTEGETRVEPGGCLLLQGQRMGARDLYRYALDQQVFDNEDDDPEPTGTRYRHIIYPAHFEDRCLGEHGKDAKAFPEGCLLDPVRLPWRGAQGLHTKSISKEAVYRVQYQQEDVDPANVLVEKVWIDGGKGSDGIMHNGCWDTDRGICEVPLNLQPPLFSIATADPSPTKYWSVQWWLYQPATNLRFLMDMVRSSLDAPDFLDYVSSTGRYVGIVNDWQERSVKLGYPISHWIVEDNAAQRFMLQYDFIKKWTQQHRVKIVAHSTTGANKLDPDYGIQMLKNVYYHGLCRFPGKDIHAKRMVEYLYKEVTTYPEPTTDDCLMAQWFFEYHLPNLSKPPVTVKRVERPRWLSRLSA